MLYVNLSGPLDFTNGSRTISIPLPTHRLALSALRALQVDAELSGLVQRSFSLVAPDSSPIAHGSKNSNGMLNATAKTENGEVVEHEVSEESKTILKTVYVATTNRMLRVAVNGFMESLGVVLAVMEELDVDVLAEQIEPNR